MSGLVNSSGDGKMPGEGKMSVSGRAPSRGKDTRAETRLFALFLFVACLSAAFDQLLPQKIVYNVP